MNVIYKQALTDYLELVNITRDFNGTLEQLYKKLNGFNFNDNDQLFDCNFKSITATIYNVNNELFVYNYIDIWDDKNGNIIKECIDYIDLIEN